MPPRAYSLGYRVGMPFMRICRYSRRGSRRAHALLGDMRELMGEQPHPRRRRWLVSALGKYNMRPYRISLRANRLG